MDFKYSNLQGLSFILVVLCSDMLLYLLLDIFYVLYSMCLHKCNYIILYFWHVSH